MRMIDYYNYAATAVYLLITVCSLFLYFRAHRKPKGSALKSDTLSPSSFSQDLPASVWYVLCVFLLLLFGGFLLMWNLTGLPDGLQQDEASIGYEAYCLAEFGIDRNGYHWPVYPITWGSGGGSPIMIYLNVITTKLFGSSVWSIRIVPAFLGTLTLLLFFLLLYHGFGRRCALAGLLVLCITPWHIILSRWSLDSNTAPFFLILASLVLLYALEKKKHQSVWLCFAAFLFGVCMYSYGSANIVVPLILLFISIWGLRHKVFAFRQLIGCFVTFVITCLPLAYFYMVNFFGFPEIATSYISFPKFTSSHFGSVFISFDSSLVRTLYSNLKGLLLTLTVGIEDEVSWNAMPGYWTLYEFTWPVTFLGIGCGVRMLFRDRKVLWGLCGTSQDKNANEEQISLAGKMAGGASYFSVMRDPDGKRASSVNALMMGELFSSLLFSLFIQQDINREVFLFLPLVYCFVLGLRFIYRAGRRRLSRFLGWLTLLLLLIGFASFAKDYYGGEYNEVAATDFMPGYGEAVLYADALAGEDKEVISTYSLVASPFMITLYYTKYDPYDFLDTVVYRDPDAEFRIATSFGHFTFGLPVEDSEDLSPLMEEEYWDSVFILTKSEAEQFDEALYDITFFKDRFAVVIRK